MRICQVVHGFPPVERTGVETYTEGLCRALARAGHRVEVFVPRRDPTLGNLSQRREERDGYAITWVTNNVEARNPREALLVPGLGEVFAGFLARERPEVVHFQHLIKLGIGLVEIARGLGIPTVYTAHDYYPICHRYTLLRPDLERCDVRADPAACARCDRALGHLNALPGLGDYQAGVLREQVSEAAWEELRAILEPAPATAADGDAPPPDPLATERAELDRMRAEAYAGIDLVLAPSRCLIRELVRGGFDPARLEHQPYGFDNEDLAGLAPVRADPGRPVRFGYIGSLAKHKGVQVLLDAFGLVQDAGAGARGAELTVYGGSSDAVHVERLRRRSAEVGARFGGEYERERLPAMLAELDAIVVPSIWLENYPLVIHEAFSAGRPVIASRLGAISESVHDGVDGLLFSPGDAADLARVLRRCVDEPELLAELARGIGPEKTMGEEARELAERYARLARARPEPRPAGDLPASLGEAVARFEELSALPTRELLVRSLAGLDGLRAAWAEDLGAPGALELLALGLAEGSEAQDRLREARNEIAWLRGKNREFDEQRGELERLFADLDRMLGAPAEGAHTREEAIAEKEREVAAAEARARELEGRIGEVEARLEEAGTYIRRKEREHLDAEAQWRKVAEYARTKEDELRWAQEQGREDNEGARAAAQVGLLAIRAQERMLNRALRPVLERLHRTLDPEGPLRLPLDGVPFVELLGAVKQVRECVEVVTSELDWWRARRPEIESMEAELERRRTLMGAFAEELGQHPLLARLLGLTKTGRKVTRFESPRAAEEEERA